MKERFRLRSLLNVGVFVGLMIGLSGCGIMMIGNNYDDRRCETRMPCPGKGGLLNKGETKYYWGDIKIITKPAGLEVELYNNGKPAINRYYQVEELEEVEGAFDGIAYTACAQSYANIRAAGVNVSGEAANADCTHQATAKMAVVKNNYAFPEGLKSKTTPTTARLYARNEKNEVSDYELVFKKNGKEITRKRIKPSINWWVWLDHLTPPALGTFMFFSREMAWWDYGTHAHLMQTRSYLTQGDIEIDLTEEIKKLGL